MSNWCSLFYMTSTAEFIFSCFAGNKTNVNDFLPLSSFVQAETLISLADLSFSDETCTLWYNLLPCKQIPGKKPGEQNEDSMFLLSKQSLDSLDLVSTVLGKGDVTLKRDRSIFDCFIILQTVYF